MWTHAIGWACSLLLVALLGFGLRARTPRARKARPSGFRLLAEAAAAVTLLVQASALGPAMLAGSAIVVLAVAVVHVVAQEKRRRTRDVITLHAANDEGKSVRLRVMSHVLEPNEKRLLQFR